MTKLRTASFLVALLLGAGCSVPDDSPLRVEGAFVPTAECAAPELDALSTSVDLSVRDTALVGFKFTSDFQATTTNVNGEDVAGPQRNDFIIDTITKSFVLETGTAFPEESKAIYLYKKSTSDGFVILNLLPEASLPDLMAEVPEGETVRMDVTFVLKGETAVGQKIETREVVYPVYLLNTGFQSCPAGQVLSTGGPCGTGGGQAGVPACGAS